MLSYWLSNASTLLLLLQRTLKASGAAGMAPLRRRSSSATLFGRMSMSHVKDSFLCLFSIDRGNNLLSEFFSFPYAPSLTALFSELPRNATRNKYFPSKWPGWWNRDLTPGRSQIPCFAVQAATYSIC